MNHSGIVSFLWGIADLIRDTFKRGKYQDVILPLTVLRRLDCVLAPTKEKVLRRREELRGRGLQDLEGQLRRASGFAFYNTSKYDFDKLCADAPHAAANLRNYIAGFSQNMREVLERFGFDNTISKLDESGLLFDLYQALATTWRVYDNSGAAAPRLVAAGRSNAVTRIAGQRAWEGFREEAR
jgi:type I restriction enzyme M protein